VIACMYVPWPLSTACLYLPSYSAQPAVAAAAAAAGDGGEEETAPSTSGRTQYKSLSALVERLPQIDDTNALQTALYVLLESKFWGMHIYVKSKSAAP